MKKQLYCKHWKKEAKITSTYIYKLIGAELNLCKACESKLRKQIIEQAEFEESLNKK
jgi:hypothetical protein